MAKTKLTARELKAKARAERRAASAPKEEKPKLTRESAIADVMKAKGLTKGVKGKVIAYIKKHIAAKWVILLSALSAGKSLRSAKRIASKVK